MSHATTSAGGVVVGSANYMTEAVYLVDAHTSGYTIVATNTTDITAV